MQWSLPLLPLVLDTVPVGLELALRQEGVPAVDLSQTAPAYPAEVSGQAARAPTAAEAPSGRFLLYDSRSCGSSPAARAQQRHQCPLDVDLLRRGWPFDPFDALVDMRSRRVAWEVDGHRLTEHVSYYDKAEIRRKLLKDLRQLIEAQGGIWLRIAAYPYPYRSVLNFRIDHDTYDRTDFASVLEQVEGHEHAVSHYVCASAFEGSRDGLSALAPFDVGSHGWWYHTYRDGRQSRENIRRGIDALASAGLIPNGFVAPHGRWNPDLARALEDLGIDHSSEFALAHDELPFFPYLGLHKRGRPGVAPTNQSVSEAYSRVLQLPVHPVCLGRFLEAGVRDAGLIERYFQSVVRAKYQRGEPILLYGQPTGRLGRWPGVLSSVFATAAEFQLLWQTTLSRFAAWWRQRRNAELVVYDNGKEYEVRVERRPKSWRLAIEYWRGDHVAAVPVQGDWFRFQPNELAYELRRTTQRLPARIVLPHQGGFKEQMRDWLDWETVTPDEEIRVDTLPGILKRGLRRLRRQTRRL